MASLEGDIIQIPPFFEQGDGDAAIGGAEASVIEANVAVELTYCECLAGGSVI